MDVNKLKKAHELLNKSQKLQVIINQIKALEVDKPLPDAREMADALFVVKEDLVFKLAGIKSEYDKEFDLL